ncbi:hypothetical protein ERY430_40538 [Erythrobacter sp. EC-HK427]|nr:hypothetical protein ERY430_40538 [Erythrobacter sp. EC-HK427]
MACGEHAPERCRPALCPAGAGSTDGMRYMMFDLGLSDREGESYIAEERKA